MNQKKYIQLALVFLTVTKLKIPHIVNIGLANGFVGYPGNVNKGTLSNHHLHSFGSKNKWSGRGVLGTSKSLCICWGYLKLH